MKSECKRWYLPGARKRNLSLVPSIHCKIFQTLVAIELFSRRDNDMMPVTPYSEGLDVALDIAQSSAHAHLDVDWCNNLVDVGRQLIFQGNFSTLHYLGDWCQLWSTRDLEKLWYRLGHWSALENMRFRGQLVVSLRRLVSALEQMRFRERLAVSLGRRVVRYLLRSAYKNAKTFSLAYYFLDRIRMQEKSPRW
jgi:hypothetical protein